MYIQLDLGVLPYIFFVYVYMYTFMCMCIYIYICMYAYVCRNIYIYIYIDCVACRSGQEFAGIGRQAGSGRAGGRAGGACVRVCMYVKLCWVLFRFALFCYFVYVCVRLPPATPITLVLMTAHAVHLTRESGEEAPLDLRIFQQGFMDSAMELFLPKASRRVLRCGVQSKLHRVFAQSVCPQSVCTE